MIFIMLIFELTLIISQANENMENLTDDYFGSKLVALSHIPVIPVDLSREVSQIKLSKAPTRKVKKAVI